MDEALTFKDPAGRTVAGILSTPAGSTDRLVVLCHGFLSHKNSATNRTLTDLLLPCGIAMFRFDFFGQGESEGPFRAITVTIALEQAMASLDLVAARGYHRLGLIGSSFGGLVAAFAAARWRDRSPTGAVLACLGLKCPVADFAEEFGLEFGDQGLAEWKATDTVPDLEGGPRRLPLAFGLYEDSSRHVAYEVAPAITAPTLIVQGDRDEYLPPHQSRKLYAALRVEKRLEILPGADHRFTKPEDFRKMTTLLADWMITHLPQDRSA